MALQYTVDDISAVPEALRGEYAARDGKFFLNVDGVVPKERLDEFRNNNIAFKKENDDLKKMYEGVDVERYRTMTEREQKIAEKKLIDAGEVDKLVDLRVAAMKTEHDKVLATLSASDAAKGKQLESLLIDNALLDVASKSGVRPTAMDDVLLRGRQTFRLHEGKATAFKGDEQQFGKDSNPLTMADWLGGLKESAPHLFAASSGGNTPKQGAGGVGGSNTMTRAQYDALAPGERAAAVRGKTLVD